MKCSNCGCNFRVDDARSDFENHLTALIMILINTGFAAIAQLIKRKPGSQK